MIHQTLLRRAVAGRDLVLVDFVEKLASAILVRFATIPALGGSGKAQVLEGICLPPGVPHFPPEALERFSEKHDQSMVTHILNGVFAGMRIAEKLPPGKALNDLEKRLWLLGYVVHDYTKVYGIKVSAGDLPVIRQAITCLGDTLNFSAFLPEWKDYLDDIAFLAQNTQTVEGANLNVREFTDLKNHPRRLEVMRMLSSYADVLVHIASPADVAQRGADDRDRATNLREKLTILFGAGKAPRLAYHRLAEVRGLISNLINNAAIDVLKTHGYEPYLFFPNGVVYLVEPGVQAQVDTDAVTDAVWGRVVEIVGDSEVFIKPWTTGFLVSSGLYELAGFEGVLAAGRRRAMRLRSNNSPARLYGFFTGKSENDLKKQFGGDMERVKAEQEAVVKSYGVPTDGRVHRLGEYLGMVFREVKGGFKKSPDVSKLLLETLGVQERVTIEETKRQKGGVYFGWFYAAARFIEANPTLDENELDELIGHIGEFVVAYLSETGVVSKRGTSLQDTIRKYVVQIVEVDGRSIGISNAKAMFEQELSRYSTVKAKRQAVCSLCSSAFVSTPQEATEIPFVNQQYSNKNPLAGTTVIRGVCPVCRIEMILRRVQQPGLIEGNKPIQLYLYPTYFFTSETAFVVKSYINELEDLNIFGLINYLRKNGFTAANLINYEGFEHSNGEGHSYTILRPHYSEHDAAGLFSFALRPLGRKPTDTDAWIVPTLYGLALPLLLNIKLVVTPSFVPIFGTGADFRETAVLDAPHGFTRYALGRDRFRVDETGDYLVRLLELYDLHLDVFAEPTNLHWAQINAVAKDVATDPLYVFAYYDRKTRNKRKGSKGKKGDSEQTGKGIPNWDVDRYVEIYQALGGETNMGFIGEIVNTYAQFYQAEYGKLDSAHAVLRPLMTAIETTVESDPQTDRDDLILLVAGAVNDDQIRVREDKADGWDPIWRNVSLGTPQERIVLSRQKIEEFARLFLERIFTGYCHGDRAILRERTNRIRSAARFYYLQNYSRKAKKEDDNG